jgi:hypothetical protein
VPYMQAFLLQLNVFPSQAQQFTAPHTSNTLSGRR